MSKKIARVVVLLLLLLPMMAAFAASSLVVAEGDVAKYTIVKLDDGFSYRVFWGDATGRTAAEANQRYLFDYVQSATKFEAIGYSQDPLDTAHNGHPVGFTYDGKIIYPGPDGVLPSADDIDLTEAVAACNAYFGFTLQTNNRATDKNFTDKAEANWAAYIDSYPVAIDSTTTISDPDTVEIPPTDDCTPALAAAAIACASLALCAAIAVRRQTMR